MKTIYSIRTKETGKTIKNGILVLSLLSFLSFNIDCQAQARLEADTIALGDQTVLIISNAEQSPTNDMLAADGIVVVGQQNTPDDGSNEQRLLITCFEPGEHWIHLSDEDSLPLIVTDVAIDTTLLQPRDIAPLERVPYTFWEIFRWILLALAIAAVAVVIWWLIDRKKRHGSIIAHREPVDTRTPDVRALESLEDLRRQQLWQAGKPKAYHTELTDIVRRFIEEATDIHATEMTSDETVEAVESGKWKVESDLLRSIFATADLVKFAKSEPLPHEHERSMQQAIEFVRTMWLAVKPAEEEEQHE